MKKYQIMLIQEHAELKEQAAEWFHQKWGMSNAEYLKSMEECITKQAAIPQWYVVLDAQKIIAGLGVIENDFHNLKQFAPNVCAVYVDEEYRNQGIAGAMLHFVCNDFAMKGINTLYLVTDHTAFYERYGWKFLCMAQCVTAN